MENTKPHIIKNYEKLDKHLQKQIKLAYPEGFSQYLITFLNKDGKYVSALPFETEDHYYLVRMTQNEADMIINEDEDYDDDGILKDEVKEVFEDKHAEINYLSEQSEEEHREEEEKKRQVEE